MKTYTPLQSTAYNIFAGTLLLLVFLPNGITQIISAPFQQWLVIIFLGVFPSGLAFLWWSKAISLAEKISDVTNFMFVTPLLATIMGFLIVRETPTIATLVGGSIIIIGLLLFKKT